ncbi:helix-turn-helix transcriptional regulator [Streptomyces sp. NPDC051976]|uniref:helix-turn-helix domain-containing protein n=1 Tax=Streptomyces sp. NPDC051976 TaxID=3154947 RepID=UPI00343D13E4
MSGAAGSRETEEFARLLRELKERSGLSYGALAKRLHMSGSTLHRYCQGTAVPGEYAPLDRVARVCRATPGELVELHRLWALADAARKPREDRAATRRAEAGSGSGAEDVGPEAHDATGATALAPADEPVEQKDPLPAPVKRRLASLRRRSALVGSATATAVLLAAVLVAHPTWGGGGGRTGEQKVAAERSDAAAEETSNTASPSGRGSTPPLPAPAAATPTRGRDAGAGPAPSSGTSAVPLTVHTRSFAYDNPCDQRFLVHSAPAAVGPFPDEQDAPRWVAAYGAVAAGDQRVAVTVQGTGADTVVLEALHVGIDSRNAPLAWNDYAMSQCGGGVDTKSFDVDLDKGRPTTTVRNGQREFPYKVSESDPEVFYVTVHTKAHDVRWNLTLDWSSGDRHGTVRIDDDGVPFRTSADAGRPGYQYTPGGSWIPRT